MTADALVPIAARSLLDRHFGTNWKDAQVLPIEGTTNRVLQLQIGGQRFAVRVPRGSDQLAQIDRRSERLIAQAASQAGIAPELLAWDEATGVLLTRWIDGETSSRAVPARSELEAMANLFRRLHALAPPAHVRRIELTGVIDGYLDALASERDPGVAVARAWRPQAAALMRKLHDPVSVLTHNDAHRGNVLCTASQRLYLLDWEYAGVGSAYFDLAAFASYHELKGADQEVLLRAYGADVATAMAFADRLLLFDYVWLLWLLVLGEDGRATARPDGVNSAAHVPRLIRRLEGASGRSRSIE